MKMQTYALDAGHAFAFALDGATHAAGSNPPPLAFGTVRVRARGEVYWKLVNAADDTTAQGLAPASDPTPTAGILGSATAAAGYYHLIATSPAYEEAPTIGGDPNGQGTIIGTQQTYQYIVGWAKASADLLVIAE